jgi:mRNA-degrading endonuclease toxin of MazEF toxin-antitoxin module
VLTDEGVEVSAFPNVANTEDHTVGQRRLSVTAGTPMDADRPYRVDDRRRHPVAVRLQPGDPVKGFIRADELTRTYVPWLTGPVGMITRATLDALAAALRTEIDL